MARRSRSGGPEPSSALNRSGSSRGELQTAQKTVFVLGAGVDVSYKVPMVSALLVELAAFAREEGSAIDRALRAHLKNLRFSFDRYAASQGDVFLAQLFADAEDLVPSLRSAVDKLKGDDDLQPVGALIDQLCTMAENNVVTGSELAGLAALAGETGQLGDTEAVLEPAKLTMSHVPSAALRNAFRRALHDGRSLTAKDREVLELFVVATSNIEQLLADYFTRFAGGTPSEQRTYLYLAWMLWAFLQFKSAGRGPRDHTLYARLPRLGGDIITFNYTNFFDSVTHRRVNYFHGRLDRYLRVDDRQLVVDAPRLAGATTVDGIVEFIHTLRLDVTAAPAFDMPSIVPPISFKPVMSREQLRTWARADDLIHNAQLIVVAGYSFALADEHFNDLLRNAKTSARVLVINPDLRTVARAATRVMRIELDSLVPQDRGGFKTLSSRRLTCVEARADDLTADVLGVLTA